MTLIDRQPMQGEQGAPPWETLRGLIDARAARGGTAYIFPETGLTLDWAEMRSRVRAVARDLTSRGYARGDSIAVMGPNSPETLTALLGVIYGGFRVVMVNLVAGADIIAYVLEHSEARAIYVSRCQSELFKQANRCGLEALDLPAAGTGAAEVALHDVSPEDQALIMYTSGTTGRPKGVMHSNASLIAGGWTVWVAHKLTSEDTGFCVLPVYHINGLCVTVMGSLVSGGKLAVVSKFSASRFWQQISQSSASWFSVVPTIISHLLQGEGGPDQASRQRLRFGRSASSALAPDVQRMFEDRFGLPIIETMGLTETAAQILSNPLPPGLRKIGSPGLPYGNEVEILSREQKPLPAGVEGEIAVRGPNVMLGYLKNPEATAATLTPEGWLLTGDLGRKDEDGYVFVTGRLKELIIKGGENIAPREVDEALYSHADVLEAAAFPTRCQTYGERVAAAVVLRPGSALTEEDLRTICVLRIGAFKAPDRIYLLEDLPKGPSGKIQRLKLAELTSALTAS